MAMKENREDGDPRQDDGEESASRTVSEERTVGDGAAGDGSSHRTDADKESGQSGVAGAKRRSAARIIVPIVALVVLVAAGFWILIRPMRPATFTTVDVTVVDSQNKPISGCDVTIDSTIVGSTTTEAAVNTTDSDGRTTVPKVGPGAISVTVSCTPKSGRTDCAEGYRACAWDNGSFAEILRDGSTITVVQSARASRSGSNAVTVTVADWND